MKRLGLLLLAIVTVTGLAGCGVTNYALKGAATTPVDDVYSCAVSQLTAMAYEIGKEDRAAGIAQGQKLTEGWWQLNYGSWGGNAYDAITVTVVDGQAGAPCIVQASGETYLVPGNGNAAGVKSQHPPSNQVQADVNALLSACKVGDIKGAATPKN